MKLVIFLFAAVGLSGCSSSHGHQSSTVLDRSDRTDTCTISNWKSVVECLKESDIPVGEVENTIIATPFGGAARERAEDEMFLRVLDGLAEKGLVTDDAASDTLEFVAHNTEYIAAVMVHNDEDRLYYYSMNNGQNQRPVELFNVNLISVAEDYPLSVQSLDWSLGIEGVEGWEYGYFRDRDGGDDTPFCDEKAKKRTRQFLAANGVNPLVHSIKFAGSYQRNGDVLKRYITVGSNEVDGYELLITLNASDNCSNVYDRPKILNVWDI